MAVKIFRFFIFSNIFIACCAVLMVNQSYGFLLGTVPGNYFIGFVFFSTLCSYSFHWYLTPAEMEAYSTRTKWLVKNKYIHIILFVAGFIGAAVFGFLLLRYWLWLLIAVVITFLYSAPKISHPYFRMLRKVALGKTIFLAFAWMYVTTLLPLFMSDKPWQADFTLFAISRFFLIYAICILFDYRDRDYDKENGIRSLITWLSPRSIAWLFILSLLLFTGFTIALLPAGHSYIDIIILLIPGLITALLYRHATQNFSDSLYYFVLDGLMSLSALLMLIKGL